MIIKYNSIKGSGPFTVIFKSFDFSLVPGIEPIEKNGLYWLNEGIVLAVEFYDVTSSSKSTTMTIPETGQTVCVLINEMGISVTSPSFVDLIG